MFLPILLLPFLPISSRESDCSDLLPHKDEVTDSETNEGDGDDRNQIRRDDDQTLQQGKRVLKTAQRKPFQRPYKNQASCGFSCRVENRRRRIVVKVHGRQ